MVLFRLLGCAEEKDTSVAGVAMGGGGGGEGEGAGEGALGGEDGCRVFLVLG